MDGLQAWDDYNQRFYTVTWAWVVPMMELAALEHACVAPPDYPGREADEALMAEVLAEPEDGG